jgi:signal peptide peptidase SppA
MRYPHIAARIFNTPLLIHPQKLDAIVAGLGARIVGRELVFDASAGDDSLQPEMFTTRRGERVDGAGYRNVDGVAVVPINGALVHKSKVDANSNYLLGYNDMAARVEHAQDNPDIHAILKVWDSPGGEVQGAFEYAQRMLDLRGKKPMYSIADGMAASAAMLGASASDKLFITNTGYAGSVGVVMRHVDFSRALANDGIAVTHIFAGSHKVDGNPYEALPASVRADFQAEINSIYDMFVAAVAKHMSIDQDMVRATQARVFMGKAAIDAGLVHGLTTTDALISELAAKRSPTFAVGQPARSSTADKKGPSMSGTQQPAAESQAPATPTTAAITQADLEKARGEGHAAGVAAGTKAERDRVTGILAHKEADGRGALAVQCVANGLTVEAAGSLLAAAPKAAAQGPFAAAMDRTPNPDVKAGEDNVEQLEPQAIQASWNKAFHIDARAPKH